MVKASSKFENTDSLTQAQEIQNQRADLKKVTNIVTSVGVQFSWLV